MIRYIEEKTKIEAEDIEKQKEEEKNMPIEALFNFFKP